MGGFEILFIITILLLPIPLLVLNHPVKTIRKLSKFFLLTNIIAILVLFPTLIIIKLKLWTSIIIIIPILFRFIQFSMNKLKIEKYLKHLDKINFVRLLYASFGSILFFYLSIDFNILYGFWFSIFLFLLIGVKTLTEMTKSNMLYGLVFGLLSNVMTLYVDISTVSKVDALVTFLFSWCVIGIPIYLIPKFRSNENTRILGFVLMPSFFLILLKKGGVTIMLPEMIQTSFFLIISILVSWSSYKLIRGSKLPVRMKQFLLPAFLILFLGVFYAIISKADQLYKVINPALILLGVEWTLLSLGRVYFPITNNSRNNKIEPMDEIVVREFEWIFTKRIGKEIFSFIFGEHYNQTKVIDYLTFILISIIESVIVIRLMKSDTNLASVFIHMKDIMPIVLIMSSIMSGVNLLSEIMDLVSVSKVKKSLKEKEAMNRGTSIGVNYFFMIVNTLIAVTFINSSINKYFIIFISIWFILLSLSFSIILSNDLQKKSYNNLKKTRHVFADMLYAIGMFSLIYFLITFYNLEIYTYNIANNIVFITIIPFSTTFISKLIGHDTIISSYKFKKWNKYRMIFLTIYFVFFLKLNTIILSNIIYYVSDNENIAILIPFTMNVLLFYQLMESTAICNTDGVRVEHVKRGDGSDV